MIVLREKSANFESKLKADQQKQKLNNDKKTGFAILTADNCKCKNILIVDDEEFNLEATANILEGMDPGLSFWKVKDGDEAVVLCEEMSLSNPCHHCDFFRLIIMDINMPKLGGMEATMQILERNKKKMEESGIAQQILVLGCTAYTDENTKTEGKANGMAHVMCKPYKKRHFVEAFVQIGLFCPEVMKLLPPLRFNDKQRTPPVPTEPSNGGLVKKSLISTGFVSVSQTLGGGDISNDSNLWSQDK
jgi:CheY-like chemotaxis protein